MLRLFNENSLETYSKHHNYNVHNISNETTKLLGICGKSTWETIYFYLIRIFSSNDKWITFVIRFLKENSKCQ